MPAAHAADTGTAADPRSRKRKRAAPKEDGRAKNREKENIEPARGLLDIFRFMQQKNELTFINSFLVAMILCSTGVLPIYQGIALVMGENIGT